MHATLGFASYLRLSLGVRGVERTVREVATEWTVPVGEGRNEQISAHKGTAPRGASATEDFFAVATTPWGIDAKFERLDVWSEPGCKGRIIRRNGGHEGTIRSIHGRQELRLGIDDHNRVNRPKRLAVVKGPTRWRIKHASRCNVGRLILPSDEPTDA